MSGAEKIAVKVTDIVPLNDLVTRFKFERVDGGLLPTFSGGAHTVVEMKDGDITHLNPYSLMSDPMDQTAYTISVRRDDAGRGGSLFMHRNVSLGDHMTISYPVNLFSLDLRAKKHLFLAGGIGITPFLAQIKQLERFNGNWELHYACRTEALGSYVDELTSHHPNETHVYYDDQKQTIDLVNLLDGQPLGTHIYVCGPKGMIDWVRKTAAADAPYLCRGGACGQCETHVIDYSGSFIHRDHWLNDAEQKDGEKIMPCVSRFEGKTLVLDR